MPDKCFLVFAHVFHVHLIVEPFMCKQDDRSSHRNSIQVKSSTFLSYCKQKSRLIFRHLTLTLKGLLWSINLLELLYHMCNILIITFVHGKLF